MPDTTTSPATETPVAEQLRTLVKRADQLRIDSSVNLAAERIAAAFSREPQP